MREALGSILGGPFSEWSWTKVSLSSSRGSLNLRSASLHAPADPLWPLSSLLHPDQTGGVWRTLICLSTSTRSPLPLMRLCPNTSSPLLPPLTPVPWPFPLPSPMLATGSTVFHLPHWVSTCRTRSSAAHAASTIGWELPFTALPTSALCC